MTFLVTGDHGLFARVRQDGQPYGAVLNIHDAGGWITLRTDLRRGFVLGALPGNWKLRVAGARNPLNLDFSWSAA